MDRSSRVQEGTKAAIDGHPGSWCIPAATAIDKPNLVAARQFFSHEVPLLTGGDAAVEHNDPAPAANDPVANLGPVTWIASDLSMFHGALLGRVTVSGSWANPTVPVDGARGALALRMV
jgi:hypothetical protein